MIRVHHKISVILLLISIFAIHVNSNARSSLAVNDAYPMYSSRDPHYYLYTQEKLALKGLESGNWREHVSFSISPFAQNANSGRNIDGKSTRGGVAVELGDIPNRWNMIALLYGDLPANQNFGPILENAKNTLFPGVAIPIDDEQAIDCEQLFGCFSIPLKYRKRGLRFQVEAMLISDFGIKLDAGIASISQTLTSTADVCDFIDLTGIASLDSNGNFPCTDLKPSDVECLLMREYKNIAQEINLNICDFCEISSEDIFLSLFWRHAYPFLDKENCAQLLLIPFFELGGGVAAGKAKDPNVAFGIPFGNNDHNSLFFTAGLDFDFLQTIEVGAEVGITHFFSKDFKNYRVPTSEFQTGIFPFTTDVSISPGLNWHFGAQISAYHFIDCLSFYFQYLLIEHQKDKICLKSADSAFKPEILAKRSCWRTKIANIAFNYDFTPHIGAGFLWQAPLSQRNTYKSTTLLFSFYAQF